MSTITFTKRCACLVPDCTGWMGKNGTDDLAILCKGCGTEWALAIKLEMGFEPPTKPSPAAPEPQISPPPYGPPFTVPSKPPSPAPHWITIAAYLANIGAGDRFVDSNGPGQVLVFIPWADYERTYVPADPSKGRVEHAIYIQHLKVWVHSENRLLRESDRVTHVLVPGEP